ncbi:MAG: hypothetical protein WCB85_07265 [Candidatus Dormiibacterota bacterium]
MTILGRIRDRLRARQLERWRAGGTYPAKVRRKYWSEDEMTRDRTRLVAQGYRVVDEEETMGSISIEPNQSVYGNRSPASLVKDQRLALMTYQRDSNP